MTVRCRFFTRFLVPWLLLMICISGCSSPHKGRANPRRDRAFIAYWPPPPGSNGLRLAVKDLIDMKGVVTTAGSEFVANSNPPALRDAQCLELARERNVTIVGKTNLTELALTVTGRNTFFGTPRNRRDRKHDLIPGGSSSGSAVAVKTGMADVAFGTDTGGSIRFPAACCGVYGLKTTFGLVPIKGVFPVSPRHLDTVGPMAKDMPRLVQGMDLLQRGFADKYEAAIANKPSAARIRIGRLYLNGTDSTIDKAIDDALTAKRFKVIKLRPSFRIKWEQADKDGKVVALADAWLNAGKYVDKKGIGAVTKIVLQQGERNYTNHYKDALKRKAAWQRDLRLVFKKVDFIALPTLQNLPPKFPSPGSNAVFEWLVFNSQNTTAVNFAGNPALAMPIALPSNGKTVPVTSLQLIGPRLSEAELLNAGRLIASEP